MRKYLSSENWNKIIWKSLKETKFHLVSGAECNRVGTDVGYDAKGWLVLQFFIGNFSKTRRNHYGLEISFLDNKALSEPFVWAENSFREKLFSSFDFVS